MSAVQRAPRREGVEVAIETSTRSPSVAVRFAERLLEEALEGERPHASDLLPALDRLMQALGRKPPEIRAIHVGTGPGSYTGLRVGIATALGLSRGTGAALFAVPSLEALAWQELAPGEEAAFLLDARAGELYFARYLREAGAVRPLAPPTVTTPAELPALLPDDLALFADSGSAALLDLTSRRGRLVIDAMPRASSLLDLASRRMAAEGPQRPEQIEPLYLRAFAAKARRR